MLGKVSVQVTIAKAFGGDFDVKLRALVEDKRSVNSFGKGYGKLYVKPKHEIKFDTLQFICDVHDKYENLEESNSFVLSDLEANFIKGIRKDGTEYYAIQVKLGNEEVPLYRTFYLSSMQIFTLKKRLQPVYEFTQSDKTDEDLDTVVNSEE